MGIVWRTWFHFIRMKYCGKSLLLLLTWYWFQELGFTKTRYSTESLEALWLHLKHQMKVGKADPLIQAAIKASGID